MSLWFNISMTLLKKFGFNVHWKKLSLAATLTVTLPVMVIIVVTIVTHLSIQREQQSFRQQLEQQAEILLDVLEAATDDALYYFDVDSLSDIIEALGEEHEILAFGRIYDHEGRIIVDAYNEYIGYNAESDPWGEQLLTQETTVFIWQADQLLAGRAVIAGRQCLGALSVGFPTTILETKLQAVQQQGIAVAIVTAGIGIFGALILTRSVTSPLHDLVKAAHHIGEGDFSQAIRIAGQSELIALGTAMEQMRAELQAFYQKLELRVKKRTQELRQSESRFHQVISSISDHIYVMEPTDHTVWRNQYISPKVELLTGYPPEKFLRDPHFWFSLIDKHDSSIVRSHLDRFSRKQNSEAEYRVRRADGTSIWVRDSGRFDPERSLIYGVVSDITDRKQHEHALCRAQEDLELRVRERTIELKTANERLQQEILERQQFEAQLQQAKELAESANRSKSEFLANMSHELRTPLNHIIGFTELVVDKTIGELNSEQEEFLHDVLHSSRHLLSLINDILDLSKVEAGKLTLMPSSVNVKGLLEHTLTMFHEKVFKHNIQLVLDIQDTPEIITTDERKLKQILYNLLSNAVKFTPDGGAIHVTASHVVACVCDADPQNIRTIPDTSSPEPQPLVMFSVHDTGIGIETKDLERIFYPFEQVEASACRKYQGTGLGLSLTKQLVELHGGQIWAQSQGKGAGSTFSFTIPVHCEE